MKYTFRQTKLSTFDYIYIILGLCFIFHNTLPVVGYYTPAILYAGIVLLLFIFSIVKIRNSNKILLSLIPIFSIYILQIIYFGMDDIPKEIYGLFQVYLYPLLLYGFSTTFGEKTQKTVFWIVGFSYIITSITTISGLVVFPTASRELATSIVEDESNLYSQYVSLNIGGFQFIYSLVLLIPVLILLTRKKLINALVGIAIILLFGYVILKSQYTTALLLFTLCMVLWFYKRDLTSSDVIKLFVLLVIAFLLGKLFIGDLLISVSEWFIESSPSISERLYDLGAFFTEKDISYGGDIDSRREHMLKSLECFYSSPIWGGSNNVGGHSFLLDSLGRFGLVGLAGYIIMYNTVFKIFYKPYREEPWYGYMCFIFVLAIIMSIVNPKDNLSVLTFTIPLFMSAYKLKMDDYFGS